MRMMRESPLRDLQERYAREVMASHGGAASLERPGAAVGHQVAAEVEYVPYGLGDDGAPPVCELVATFGQVEVEYAVIRRGVGVMDCPHRGTLLVTGSANDRCDLLNRLVTQELKDFGPNRAAESFWLNRKGRIEADLLLIELGDRMLIDVDILQAPGATKTLSEFVFAEDVSIADVSETQHHIALHGRQAIDALAAAVGEIHPVNSVVHSLEPGNACLVSIAGCQVVVARRDQIGEPGIELIMRRDDSPAVWTALQTAGEALASLKADAPGQSSIVNRQSSIRLRPIGWSAFNIARIEAGTPLMNIDFGTTNLPHETGILKQRVSFTKGCYLGQEIVARMESLGKPKQMLVGLRMSEDVLPEAGAQVFAIGEKGSMGEQVGVVTSSTLSPMLGAAPIAFAMLRSASTVAGSNVLVNGEGSQTSAKVGELQFYSSTG